MEILTEWRKMRLHFHSAAQSKGPKVAFYVDLDKETNNQPSNPACPDRSQLHEAQRPICTKLHVLHTCAALRESSLVATARCMVPGSSTFVHDRVASSFMQRPVVAVVQCRTGGVDLW